MPGAQRDVAEQQVEGRRPARAPAAPARRWRPAITWQPSAVEEGAHHLAHLGVVFDQQHAQAGGHASWRLELTSPSQRRRPPGDRGRYSVTRGAGVRARCRSSIAPCDCLTKPYTVLRPRPVPRPDFLGGEEGLERALASPRRTCRCRCRRWRSRRSRRAGRARVVAGRGAPRPAARCTAPAAKAQRAAVGHRVARVDGDVEQRRLELARVGQHRRAAGRPPRPRCGCAGRACGAACRPASGSSCADVHRARLQHLAAREREQLAGELGAAPRGARGRADQLLAVGVVGQRAAAPRSTCRLPWITVSRLLKSCAMPPVSWPTLSRRCAWLSASSDWARCRLVASRLASDSRKRSSSSPKRCGSRERTDKRADRAAAVRQRHRQRRWSARLRGRPAAPRSAARVA